MVDGVATAPACLSETNSQYWFILQSAKNFWAQNMALNGTTSRREDSPNVSFQKTKCPTPAGISFLKTPTVHNINGMTLHVSKNKMPNSCGHFTFQNTHCLQMKNSLNSLNPLLRLPPNTLQNFL
jgi:hypothetical protein